jgi:hypothetical protein
MNERTNRTKANAGDGPTVAEFKEWCLNHGALAFAVVQAQAAAEVTREKVDAYVRPIFDGFGFNYCGPLVEKVNERGGENLLGLPLPSPRELYLCEDPRVEEYFAACDAEHRRQGYDLPAGHCPALVAEHLLIQAQNALLDSGMALFGLNVHPCGDDRAKMLRLLLGACLKGSSRLAA